MLTVDGDSRAAATKDTIQGVNIKETTSAVTGACIAARDGLTVAALLSSLLHSRASRVAACLDDV